MNNTIPTITKPPSVEDNAGTKPVHYITALERLIDGNRRFVQDVRSVASLATSAQRVALAAAQSPFAVILSCSDSRVPAEMVFDQGLGTLFVVRVAGNVVAPSLVGSIEYAVQTFGVQLVVVMGHTGCGAVKATLEHLARRSRARELPESGDGRELSDSRDSSESVLDIVERIRPAVEPLTASVTDKSTLMALASRANIRASARQLRHGSHLIESRVQTGELLVVGAEYSLQTGVVDVFDGLPDSLRESVQRAAS